MVTWLIDFASIDTTGLFLPLPCHLADTLVQTALRRLHVDMRHAGTGDEAKYRS